MHSSTLPSTSVLVGGGQRHAPAALYPRERPGNHCIGAWWASGPVWRGAENVARPSGIGSPDRPARNESLYRLSYPGPRGCQCTGYNYVGLSGHLELLLYEEVGRVAQSVQRLTTGWTVRESNPGGGEIFRPSRPALEPIQPPVQWVPGLSRG